MGLNKIRTLKRGFMTLEYVLWVSIVIAALIGVSVYLKRAICGKWRSSADTFGYGRQYDPKITTEVP